MPRRDKRAGAVAVAALAESCLAEVRPKCTRLLGDVEAAAGETMPLLQFGSDAQRKHGDGKKLIGSVCLSHGGQSSRGWRMVLSVKASVCCSLATSAGSFLPV